MSRLSRIVGLAVFGIALAGFQSHAFAQFGVGGHVGYFDFDHAYVGANAVFDLPIEVGDSKLKGNPEFNYYFVSEESDLVDVTFWQVALNALYPLDLIESADTYVGAGLIISRWSADYSGEFDSVFGNLDFDESRVGLLAKIGATFGGSGSIQPFGEVGFDLIEDGGLFLQGGARISVGG
jgi:hypothetical protein